NQRRSEHPLAGSNLDIGIRISCTIPTLSGGVDGRKIVEITIGVGEKKGIGHWTTVSPVYLKIDEGFTGHSEQRNAFVQQYSRDVKFEMIGQGIFNHEVSMVFEDMRAIGLQQAFAKFPCRPAQLEGHHIIG